MPGSSVRDDGFSMIEVLFSAFIAFFVLTAIFAVLVVSTGQGRIASADVVAANLGQLVVEQARSIPYDSVGTTDAPSGQPVGVLPAQETTVFQNLTFEIERQVVWVDDPSNNSQPGQTSADYKQLTVAVRWQGGHATPLITFIRDHSNESPPMPSVRWITQPLKPGSQEWPYPVLFSGSGSESQRRTTYVWDGLTTDGHLSAVASIQASASIEATGALISRMQFWCGQYSMTAPWVGSLTPVLFPADDPLPLDLQSVDASGNVIFKEGQNTIKVVATTNMLSYQTAFLQVTVDNTAAAFPSTATVSLTPAPVNRDRYRGDTVLNWVPPDDGPNQPTTRYDLTLEKAPGGSTLTTELPFISLGGSGVYPLSTGSPATVEMSPFTAYKARLRPRSIRGLASHTVATSPWCLTAPRLNASVFNQATNKKAPNSFRFDLQLQAPTQVNLATLLGGTAILYDVYMIDSGTYVYPGTGDLPSSARLEVPDQTSLAIPVQTGTSCRKYFQIEAKVMNGSTVVSRTRSNVVGALTTGPTFQQSMVVPLP